MKKILFICLCLFTSAQLTKAQVNAGLYVGAGPTQYSTFGILFGAENHIFRIGFDAEYESFRKRGDLKRDIGWDEYSEDHRSEGEFINFFNIGYSYQVHKNFLVGVQSGFGRKKQYRNSLDPTRTFGDNGRYYKEKRSNKIEADLGVNINYIANLKNKVSPIMMGVHFGTKTGMIFTVGFFFSSSDMDN